MPQVDFRLYLITDRHQCEPHGLLARIEAALHGGVDAVQLRDKDLSTRERYEIGMKLREMTTKHGARLFINNDAALARAIGADGVHLPQDGLPADVCRTVLEPHMLIGVSAHSLPEAQDAEARGADFITFGPVYHTPSKARYGPPVGLNALRETCTRLTLPVYALGGIKKTNTDEVISAGAAGIAMISAILAADEPDRAAAEMKAAIRLACPAHATGRKVDLK
ncbi:MAG: thiamine phosphate synthase [Candidatus Abyssubacteria bacterium]